MDNKPNLNTEQDGSEQKIEPELREKSAIDSLNERLYSPNQNFEKQKINYGKIESSPETKSNWSENEIEEDVADRVTGTFMKKKKTFIKAFVLSAIGFFVISIAIGAFVLLGGRNQVSSENIIISLKGAPTAPAGKIFDFSISIENKNTVSLEKSKLTVTYPDGTRNPKNPQNELLRDNLDIGLIASNSVSKKELNSILYGDKGSQRIISITYEYSVPGSNTPFIKKQDFEVTIDASPIIVEVEMGNEFTSGQNATSDITISSNTDEVVKDVMLVVEYPFGFEFKSASPKTSFGNEIWYLGTFAPNENKKISITGQIIGASSDERTIRFKLGVRDSQNINEISSLISETTRVYKIRNPLLGVSLSINNRDSGSYITDMGSLINGAITVWNNTGETVENIEVSVSVPAGYFEEQKIKVEDGGFYRSSDRKIVWDRNSTTALKSVGPNNKVILGFNAALLSASILGSRKNPEIDLLTSVKGQKVSGGNDSVLQSEISRNIKIKSRLSLIGQSLYSTGNIVNSGPIPPVPNQKTTYTIILSLTNSYNNLSRTVVTAKLPSYVDWEDVVYPSSETVSYDPTNKEVAWIVGPLSANTGIGTPARSVAFKVGLVPSVTQVGSVPILLEKPVAEAIDDFTKEELTSSKDSITTRIQNDPIYRSGIDTVKE